MSSDRPKYVFPARERVHASAAESGANVYMLHGRVHFEVADSDAADDLERRGALHFANLRFDAAPLVGAESATRIDCLRRETAWLRLLAVAAPN